MKKYIILIPIYNDRESLTKLIENINSEIKDLNSEISVVAMRIKYSFDFEKKNLSEVLCIKQQINPFL